MGQTICSSSAPRSTRDASRTRCSHLYRPILREMRARRSGGCLRKPQLRQWLIELRNELEAHGFHTIAGAGIPTEHVFSDKLATGRPDADDLAQIHAFGIKAAEKITSLTEIPAPIAVRGDDPVGPYYTPLGTDGKPAVFLKAKPVTDPENVPDAASVQRSVRWALSRQMHRTPAPVSALNVRRASRSARLAPNTSTTRPFCPTLRCWSRTIHAEVRRSILSKDIHIPA